MITRETLDVAKKTAEELRQRGEQKQAQAIEALLEVARDEAIPSLDLLTSTQVGDLLGVSGQTIKNWVRQGRIAAYRVGGRIMVPQEAVAEYVRRARTSLDLDEVPDEEAARLVDEGRSRR
jgi:excisionase family DNA binding protein